MHINKWQNCNFVVKIFKLKIVLANNGFFNCQNSVLFALKWTCKESILLLEIQNINTIFDSNKFAFWVWLLFQLTNSLEFQWNHLEFESTKRFYVYQNNKRFIDATVHPTYLTDMLICLLFDSNHGFYSGFRGNQRTPIGRQRGKWWRQQQAFVGRRKYWESKRNSKFTSKVHCCCFLETVTNVRSVYRILISSMAIDASEFVTRNVGMINLMDIYMKKHDFHY